MEELKIVYLPPGELTPDPRNARKHTPEDLTTIRASIHQFGFNDPVGIWGDRNIIVEGEGRYLVQTEDGADLIPCIRLDHMTDEQRRAYALAHNKTAEMSGWDFTKLEAELAELEMDFDMSEFGFTDDALPPIPDNLDADTDYDEEAPLAIKLIFPNFTAYSMYEGELKGIAERMGAQFAIVKA